MHVNRLDHLNMTVESLEESTDWYGRLFGFKKVEEGTRPDGTPWAILRSGEALLCMYERPGAGTPETWHSDRHHINHFGLAIHDRGAWEAVVSAEGIPIRHGGAVRYPHSTSWYVVDPTGYEIEVALWDDDVRFGSD